MAHHAQFQIRHLDGPGAKLSTQKVAQGKVDRQTWQRHHGIAVAVKQARIAHLNDKARPTPVEGKLGSLEIHEVGPVAEGQRVGNVGGEEINLHRGRVQAQQHHHHRRDDHRDNRGQHPHAEFRYSEQHRPSCPLHRIKCYDPVSSSI